MAETTRSSTFPKHSRRQATNTTPKSTFCRDSKSLSTNFQAHRMKNKTKRYMARSLRNISASWWAQYFDHYIVNVRSRQIAQFQLCGGPSQHQATPAQRWERSLYQTAFEIFRTYHWYCPEGGDLEVEETSTGRIEKGRERGKVRQNCDKPEVSGRQCVCEKPSDWRLMSKVIAPINITYLYSIIFYSLPE